MAGKLNQLQDELLDFESKVNIERELAVYQNSPQSFKLTLP